MQDIKTPLPVGMVIRGRYVVEGLLGKGSSGNVYLVKDQRVKNVQANLFTLKEEFATNKAERYHLFREGILLRQLQHRALPRVYDVFKDDKRERVYLLMEYIEGQDLETLRQQQPEQRFSWLETMSIMAPIIDAVGYLHRQQLPIIHGNIKPASIIEPKAEFRFILVDYSIVKEYDSAYTPVHSRSLNYRAPEQYNRSGETQIDIYGLGSTFYTLVTGVMPADGLSRLTLLENQGVDPLKAVNELIPAIPASIANAIYRAMSMHVHNRFSSVEQFREALWEIGNVSSVDQLPSMSSRKPSAGLLQSAIPRPVATQDTPVSAPKQQRASRSQQLSAFLPIADKQVVKKLVSPIVRNRLYTPRSWKPGVLLLIVLALLISLGLSTGFWVHGVSHPATSSTLPTSRVISPPARSTSTISRSGTYPTLVKIYNGTIYDLAVNISTSMSLSNIQQNQGKISGYFTVGSKLKGSGPFSGTIDTAKHLQFIVTDAAGHTQLFFEGVMQSATSLSGDYYRCNQTQGLQCRQIPGDYGIWSVVVTTSKSSSIIV